MPKRGNPTYNVVIVGAVAYLDTLSMQWERAVEILNYGGLMAFMAVNLALSGILGFTPLARGRQNPLLDVIAPCLGFLFCLVIFLGLQGSTLVAGTVWVVVGCLYVILKTRALEQRVDIDFRES